MAAGRQGLRATARGRVRRVQQAPRRRPLTRGARTLTGAVLAVALAAAGLTGCSAPQAVVVGVALPSGGGRWDDVAGVLRDRIEAAGFTVDLRVADDDIPTQVRQVEQLLDDAPRAVIIAPIDPTSLTPVLEGAPSQTEVIAFGTLVRDTTGVDRLVAFDAAAEGRLQATALLQGLGLIDAEGVALADAPVGPFRIELFAGSVDDDHTEPSFTAAMAVLQPYLAAGTLVVGSGETTLDATTTLRGNATTAGSRLTRLLHDVYAESNGRAWPDAILTPSDVIARGVAAVLAAAGAVAGEGFPVLTGRGAELRSVVALRDGFQYATLLEDPRLLAAEAADRVIEALRAAPTGDPDPSASPTGTAVDNGARVMAASLVPPQIVLADDVDDVLVASGYWTRRQVDDAITDFGVEPVPAPSPTPTPGG